MPVEIADGAAESLPHDAMPSWSESPVHEGFDASIKSSGTLGDLVMHGDFLFLKVDEEVSDESEGLLLHETVHVLLTDLDAGDIHALHIITIYRGRSAEQAGQEVGVEGTHRAYARRARDRNLYLQFLIDIVAYLTYLSFPPNSEPPSPSPSPAFVSHYLQEPHS